MRPRVILATVAAAALIVILAVSLRHNEPGSASNLTVETALASADQVPVPVPRNSVPVHHQPPSPSEVAAVNRQRAESIEQAQSTIALAAANHGPDSLKVILDKLDDPEKAVRKAAIEALGMLNDREAIPFLQAAADRTVDTEDKALMLNAIHILETPSLTELQPDPPVANR